MFSNITLFPMSIKQLSFKWKFYKVSRYSSKIKTNRMTLSKNILDAIKIEINLGITVDPKQIPNLWNWCLNDSYGIVN